MRRLLLPLALLLAACSGASPPAGTPAGPSPSVTPPAGSPPTSAAAERCFPDDAGPDSFVRSGVVGTAGGPGGDARIVSEIGLGSPRPAPGDPPAPCERLVVELATAEGAPATSIGVAGVELLADRGILRITLPPIVATTAIADTLLAGHLVGRVYVVEAPDGGLTVDAHLGAAVAAAVAPARRGSVVVDLRRVGALPNGPPVAGGDVVLLAPVGSDAGYPIAVSGYARSRNGELTVTLEGPDGEVSTTVAVPDHPWGWFEVVFPEGPVGTVGLTVGGLGGIPLRIG